MAAGEAQSVTRYFLNNPFRSEWTHVPNGLMLPSVPLLAGLLRIAVEVSFIVSCHPKKCQTYRILNSISPLILACILMSTSRSMSSLTSGAPPRSW